jgi:hypothetical protein
MRAPPKIGMFPRTKDAHAPKREQARRQFGLPIRRDLTVPPKLARRCGGVLILRLPTEERLKAQSSLTALVGVDCCGCIVVRIAGENAELRCNECDVLVGVVAAEILKALLGVGTLRLACPRVVTRTPSPDSARFSWPDARTATQRWR